MPNADALITKCSCDTFNDSITLTNNYDVDVAYSINNIGPSIVDSDIKDIVLAPGQRYDVTNTYRPICDLFGTYQITTEVKDSLGNNLRYLQTINIGQCKNIDAKVDIKKEICSNNQNSVEIEIINNAKFEDEIKINYDSDTILTSLKPGDKKKISLNISYHEPGVFFQEINITSPKTGYFVSLPTLLDVKKCVDYSFSIVGFKDKICEGKNNFVIEIENSGDDNLKADIKVNSTNSNVKISNSSVNFKSNERAFVNLYVDSDIGKDTLTIKVGDKYQTYYLEAISEESCSRLKIENNYFLITNQTDKLIIDVKNAGINEETYDISADIFDEKISIVNEIKFEEIRLQPTESRKLVLNFLPLDTGEYILRINGKAGIGTNYEKEVPIHVIGEKYYDKSWNLFFISIILLILLLFSLTRNKKKSRR